MIAKHVPMRSLGKSDFAGLVEYVTDAQNKDHRLGGVQVTNCDAATVRDAITEVLATQHANTRAKGDKTYHLIVSWRAGEDPSGDTLRAIEERICVGLGFGEHQRVSAVHHDTDNLHLHIAINKIHPTRHTLHEPYYPYRALAELCTAIERDHGLERDNHEPRRRGAESRAADMERHAGVQSLVGWIQRECLDEIRGAHSWQALHQVLRENGLELRARANGFVFESEEGAIVKASTVARDLSRPSLEARLGPFEAAPGRQEQTPAKRQYRKDPIRLQVDTAALYANYQAAQRSLSTARAQSLERVRHRKSRLIEAAKRAGRLRRATIKLVGEGRVNKRLLYAQASMALRNEIRAINHNCQRERSALYTEHGRRTWADWLRSEAERGKTEALVALRARGAAQGLRGNTVRGESGARPGHALEVDSISKKGTIVFRAGACAVRDDGDKLQVSRGADRQGLQHALRLAMARYGERITVTGTAEFKAQIIRAAIESQFPITFADPTLEVRRRTLLAKENHVDRPDRPNSPGRAGCGVGRPDGGPAADRHSLADTVVEGGGGKGRPELVLQPKPDVGGLGKKPPPASRHRLRAMSELGVVCLADGIEVLLPRDVPRHVEQQGTPLDDALRRGISRPGVTASGSIAADKYIAEREAKRLAGLDVPKHVRSIYATGALTFRGTRQIEGNALALLKQGDEVVVVPIDRATAQRLTRIAVGDAVSLTPNGSIRTSKAKSR